MNAKIANVPYGKIIADLVARYPIRNQIWTYVKSTNAFVVEDSSLSASRLDPWNRPMPAGREIIWHGQGEDREIGGWTTITSIRGTLIELTILND